MEKNEEKMALLKKIQKNGIYVKKRAQKKTKEKPKL